MRIRVTKSRYWYEVGEVYTVLDGKAHKEGYYRVDHPKNTGTETRIVHDYDCEVISEEAVELDSAKVTVLKDETLGGIEREYAEVKRKARVGEQIKIVDLDHGSSGGYYYRLGNVATVEKEYPNGTVRVDFTGNDYVLEDGKWSVGFRDYVVLEPTDIVRVNGERLRMVERRANVGERVIITKTDYVNTYFDRGFVGAYKRDSGADIYVDFSGGANSWTDSDGCWYVGKHSGNSEYRVLEPVASAQPAPEPSTPSITELIAITDGLTDAVAKLTRKITELETRVKLTEEDVVVDEKAAKPVKELTRDDVIERAKADVAKLLVTDRDVNGNAINFWPEVPGKRTEWIPLQRVEFVINRDKRTVVALIRYLSDYVDSGTPEIYARGIAKAAPGDVFNSHIGRAIALRRALGLEVPVEYTNAPQPSEPRVGDIVKWTYKYDAKVSEVVSVIRIDTDEDAVKYRFSDGLWDELSTLTVLDDSREANEEVAV